MTARFREDIDFEKNQLLQACFESLAAAPSDPAQGQVYYDTTLETPRVWNETGAAWEDLFSAGGGGGGTCCGTLGAGVPSTASYLGVNVGGNLTGVGGVIVGGVGTLNANLFSLGGTALAIGTQVMAASIPVTVASDQTLNARITGSLPSGSNTIGTVLQGGGAWAVTVTSGSVSVSNFPVTQAVSGTVTANQGNANSPANAWPVLITNTSDTAVKPGDAVNNAVRVNVVATSSVGNAAAGATGSSVPADADYSGLNVGGNLRGQTGVNPSGSVYAAQTDVTSIGGATVALGQTTMANSFPVTIANNQSAVPVSGTVTADQGGSWTVSISTAPFGATGSSVPADADYLGLNVGGNLRGWTGANPSGAIFAAQIDVASVGGATVALGQAAMASSFPVTIANNQSAVPISGTVNQGTAAAGSGVWPVAITDTSDNIVKAGDNTNHAVRVNIVTGSTSGNNNAAAGATGSSVPADADYVGLNVGGNLRGQTGVNPSGSIYAAQTDITSIGGATVITAASGELGVGFVDLAATSGNITAVDSGTSSNSGAGSQSLITGTPTAGSFITAPLNGHSSVAVEISGTFSGTVQFERSYDGGTTYVPVSLVITGSTSSPVSTSTTIGSFHGNAGAATNFRVRCTAFTSGPITIKIQPGFGVSAVGLAPNLSFNLSQVGGNSVATAASGIAKVGLTDGSGNAITSTASALDVNLKTSSITVTVSGTGSTGSSVPSTAFYEGLNVSGNLRGQTGVNPSGSVFAAQTDITSIGGSTAITSVSGALGVGGDTASGSSDAGNPLKVGGVAVNAEPTAVTNAQRVNGTFTLTGKQIVQPYANPENTINGNVTTTDASTHNLFASQGAGVRAYITSIQLMNTSATVTTVVTLTDGTSTLYLPAPAGGGCTISLPDPFRSAAATAVTIQAGSAATTISVSAMGHKGT